MARTILVVDDETTLRETLVDALEADGFRVVAAADGREALALFRAERPDLVLLDVMLPELSGRRGLPDHPRRIERSDRHADGQGLRARQGRRARARRRRLRHEAVQPPRAVGPDPGALPAVGAGGRAGGAARGRAISIGSRSISPGTACSATARRCRSSPRRSSCSRSCIRHPGQVFTRDQLLERVWGYDYAGETRTVDVHIHWLRSQVEADPSAPAVHPHGARRRLRVPSARLSARRPER